MAAFLCGQDLGKWASGMGAGVGGRGTLNQLGCQVPCRHQAGNTRERAALLLFPRAPVGRVRGHSIGGTGARANPQV